MGKTYKDFEKKYIGSSDFAALTMTGFNAYRGVSAATLDFGGDGSYDAYFVTADGAEIGGHYAKVADFNQWLRIYDDTELVLTIKADRIEVYRAGDYGCIIKAAGGIWTYQDWIGAGALRPTKRNIAFFAKVLDNGKSWSRSSRADAEAAGTDRAAVEQITAAPPVDGGKD